MKEIGLAACLFIAVWWFTDIREDIKNERYGHALLALIMSAIGFYLYTIFAIRGA